MFDVKYPKDIAKVQHLVTADVTAQEIGDSMLEGRGAQEFRLLLHFKLFRIVKMHIWDSNCC